MYASPGPLLITQINWYLTWTSNHFDFMWDVILLCPNFNVGSVKALLKYGLGEELHSMLLCGFDYLSQAWYRYGMWYILWNDLWLICNYQNLWTNCTIIYFLELAVIGSVEVKQPWGILVKSTGTVRQHGTQRITLCINYSDVVWPHWHWQVNIY